MLPKVIVDGSDWDSEELSSLSSFLPSSLQLWLKGFSLQYSSTVYPAWHARHLGIIALQQGSSLSSLDELSSRYLSSFLPSSLQPSSKGFSLQYSSIVYPARHARHLGIIALQQGSLFLQPIVLGFLSQYYFYVIPS